MTNVVLGAWQFFSQHGQQLLLLGRWQFSSMDHGKCSSRSMAIFIIWTMANFSLFCNTTNFSFKGPWQIWIIANGPWHFFAYASWYIEHFHAPWHFFSRHAFLFNTMAILIGPSKTKLFEHEKCSVWIMAIYFSLQHGKNYFFWNMQLTFMEHGKCSLPIMAFLLYVPRQMSPFIAMAIFFWMGPWHFSPYVIIYRTFPIKVAMANGKYCLWF